MGSATIDNGAVPIEEWVLDDQLIGAGRKAHLLAAPLPYDLIASVSETAVTAGRGGRIQLVLVQSVDEPEYLRAEAKIPIPPELFDSLLNGRSGYRAHYYASPERGADFNRSIVNALRLLFSKAATASYLGDQQETIGQSLRGGYSKIWVVGDGAAFLNSPAALKPARWAAHWRGNGNAFGLRLPCPAPPQIDLKGTFVRPETNEEWVYEGKLDRDKDIHNTGWT